MTTLDRLTAALVAECAEDERIGTGVVMHDAQRAVRAVLAELREPDAAMAAAARKEVLSQGVVLTRENAMIVGGSWKAVIDAILNEREYPGPQEPHAIGVAPDGSIMFVMRPITTADAEWAGKEEL